MSKKQVLTVLMYHGITSDKVQSPQVREVGAELYDVPLEDFQTQMRWIKENQFNVKLLTNSEDAHSDKDIIITFDDGELNNYQCAFPELKSCGFSAYFFIITKRVGKAGYLGFDEIKRLHEAGMHIGSHGFSHEILTNLKDTQIEEEFSASKKYLERNLEIDIDNISIPRGFCSDKIIQMAYDAGYSHIFISEKPKNLHKDCYSRIAVKSDWTVQRFQQALEGHVPTREIMTTTLKNLITLIFKESGYNRLRNIFIRLFK